MRFALVSDVHFGPAAYHEGKLRKLTHRAPELLTSVIERLNEVDRPELLINLGDCIEDENREADLERYGAFVEVLGRSKAPLLHVAGTLSIDTWQGRRQVSLRVLDAALPA